MKINAKYLIVAFIVFLAAGEVQAQYGYGRGYGYGSRGGYGYGSRGGYGRQRSNIPRFEDTPKAPEPKTAEQIVDGEMPSISEALELNEFETAILSSTLKKYVQQRIEMQILKLTPEKMREGMEKITKEQDKELMAGLPLEKYEAFVELQKNGVKKTQKEKKKKKKKKRKKKT